MSSSVFAVKVDAASKTLVRPNNGDFYAANPPVDQTARDAASAASSAAGTAQTTANSAQTTANAALPKSGGTMTGAIVLAADPSANMQAATKQYVDAHSGGSFVGFSATATAGTQSISANTYTKVVFNSVEFDSGSLYSTSNNRFTAAAAGKYLICAQCDVTQNSGTNIRIIIAIYKNGSAFRRIRDDKYNPSINDNIFGGTCLMNLAANDYIEIYAMCTNAGTVYGDSSLRSHFQAVKVG